MDNTYVKLYRSLLDHEMLSYDNNAFLVFTKLLLKVNRHTGSLRTGRMKLAAMTNLKPSTCRDALQRLVDDNIVTVTTTGKYSDISICNWHSYQGRDDKSDDRTTSASRLGNDTITRTKNKNNNITPASADVDELFNYWFEQTGIKIESKLPSNQATCQRMLKVQGLNAMQKLIRTVAKAQKNKYAPRIADFVQLNARLTELLTWAKSEQPKMPASMTTGGSAPRNTNIPDDRMNMTRTQLQQLEYSS